MHARLGRGWHVDASAVTMPAAADGAQLAPVDPAIEAMLVGMERYNPSNVNPLEAYVEAQCFNGTYNLDANLALLKLYAARRPRKRRVRAGTEVLTARAGACERGETRSAPPPRRYQFNPAQTNIDTIAKMLIKSLMQLPANDFTLYLSLLSDAVVRARCAAWARRRPAARALSREPCGPRARVLSGRRARRAARV